MPNILSKIELPNGTVCDIKSYKTMSIPMGSVDSTSTSTAFTATIDGISELIDGVCVWLTNGVVTSAAGYTININGLGAKPVYISKAAETASSTQFNVAYTVLLIYNSSRVSGGCWDYVYGYDADTTYSLPKLGCGYTTCSTATATAAKTASLSNYVLATGGIVCVKFTNDVNANATLNINSKGAKNIYYQGAKITDGIIKANDTVVMVYSSAYHIIAIDRALKSFSNIKVDSTTITANTPQDTLELVAGTNITLTPDATNDKVTINADLSTYAPLASPAFTGTPTAPTATAGTNTTQIATTAFVKTAVDNLPEPMVFKGSLGTGGTITTLPTASSSNKGYVYKVITAGTYASQSAKIGDTFISDGSAWVLIPSGDEPSGTVTSIKIEGTSPIVSSSSSAITTSGTRTISHADSGVDAGTYTKVTVNATGHVTDGANPTTVAGYGITDAVTNVAYDTTNKKFTKTVNGTTSNIASLSTISIGSASAGTAIPADDITSWTTNTPTKVVPNTVVTGGTTTDIPNISKKTVVTSVTKKTVVTSASGATATVSGCTLTLTNGSFGTGDSVTVSTGDSVTVGTAIKAYTSLTTGDACTVTAGTAASLNYTAKSIPNISVASKTVATGFTTT